jgi:hypothetical protein
MDSGETHRGFSIAVLTWCNPSKFLTIKSRCIIVSIVWTFPMDFEDLNHVFTQMV